MHWLAAGYALLLLPFFGLLGAIVTAVVRRRSFAVSSDLEREKDSWPPLGPAMLCLVPAHDEEKGIETTVRSLLAQEYPRKLFRVVVVADNCSDQTAAKAREAGAYVLERSDGARRGKGFALEFALDVLEKSRLPWEGVVIIDADTVLEPDVLRLFAVNLMRGCDWQQGYYTVSNPGDSWRTKLVTVALALFNGIWPAGADLVGLGSPLRGNGMAFSRRGLRRIGGLKAYGLAEDLELSWRLRLAGEHVHFVPQAIVRGTMVVRGGPSAASQRLRWERGRAAMRSQFRRLIWTAPHVSLGWRLMATVDLYFPPLAGLTTWLLAAAVLSVGVGGKVGAILVAIYSAELTFYLLAPFVLGMLPAQYFGALIFAPAYMLWKLYLSFFPAPRQWVRTARD